MTVALCRFRVIAAATSISQWQCQLPGRSLTTFNQLRYFTTSKNPPHSKNNSSTEKEGSDTPVKQDITQTTVKDDGKASTRRGPNASSKQEKQPTQRFKQPRRKEWKQNYASQRATPKALHVIQPSIYYYNPRPIRQMQRQSSESAASDRSSSRSVLPSINASAVLDPLKYCKASSKISHTHGVSRSISGTDAARRLLRGKKNFIVAARSLQSEPALLEGHGVPPKLFQHCIDMADALLLQYNPDATECTFHNYTPQTATGSASRNSKLPTILRIRSRDTTNICSPWPPQNSKVQDWDYHLDLYLTVMERIACHLGMVLQKKQTPGKNIDASKTDDWHDQFPGDIEDDDDEFTSSSFLFPNSRTPQWNVDILRGAYYELQKDGPSVGTISKANIPPMPIVEFTQESENTCHVLVRVQGYSSANLEFGSERSKQPVTLVFDACFRNDNGPI